VGLIVFFKINVGVSADKEATEPIVQAITSYMFYHEYGSLVIAIPDSFPHS
jgi:hypothetical protein